MSLEKDRSASLKEHAKHESDAASFDDGIDFGGDSKLPPPPILTEEQERKLWRKVDLRLMPILSLMYLFSFLDRGEWSQTIRGNHFTDPFLREHWYECRALQNVKF